MNSKEYEDACENDRILRAELKSKLIIMCIYSVAIVVGLGFFITYRITGVDTFSSVCGMLTIWACGSIANIFDSDSGIRKYLRKIGNTFKKAINRGSFLTIISSLIGVIIGAIFGFAIMGAFSPIVVIVCLFAILRVKKQIANNNAVLSRFQTENSQS